MEFYNPINCNECTSKSSCFRELSANELKFINDKRVEITFAKGEILLKQHSFATHILYLKKGLVKKYLEGKNKSLILSIIPSGNLIGLSSMYTGNFHPYSITAYSDTVVCQIDIQIFKSFLEKNASFAREVVKEFNMETNHLYKRFYTNSYKNIPGKFADSLLYLYENVYKVNHIHLDLSRKDLAEFCGISLESLSRIIHSFKEEGIIQLSGKKLEIRDMHKLRKISENG